MTQWEDSKRCQALAYKDALGVKESPWKRKRNFLLKKAAYHILDACLQSLLLIAHYDIGMQRNLLELIQGETLETRIGNTSWGKLNRFRLKFTPLNGRRNSSLLAIVVVVVVERRSRLQLVLVGGRNMKVAGAARSSRYLDTCFDLTCSSYTRCLDIVARSDRSCIHTQINVCVHGMHASCDACCVRACSRQRRITTK